MGTPRSPLRLSTRWGALGVVLFAGMSSCTFIFDGDEKQCRSDADCEERSFADSVCNLATNTCEPKPVDPKWACLDGKDPPKATGEPIQFRFEVVAGVNRVSLSNVELRACSALDPNCKTPSFTAKAVAGTIDMTLPDNFKGFFEARGTDASGAANDDIYVPELVFLPPREIARGAVGRRILMFTPDDADALLATVKGRWFKYDPDEHPEPNGVLIATALDCQSTTTAGITFSLPPESKVSSDLTIPFYTGDTQFPSRDLTETNSTGTFGLTNLNEGSAALKAVINPLNGQPLVDEAVAVIRRNWLTSIYVEP